MSTGSQLDWVSGKGGVGKSTFAYLLAQHYASQNKKTLLVEIGDKSFFSYALEKEISYQESEVEKNLFISHWQWRTCLTEYVEYLVRVKSLVSLFFDNDIMKNIVSVAPGLPEISILGKLTSGIRQVGPKFEWDQIVFDAHSTGHSLAFLRAPRALHDTIGLGPLGQHAKGIDETLTKSNQVRYHLVTLPEELPTQESLEFQKKVESEFGISFAMVMNQKWRDSYLHSEEEENENFKKYIEHKKKSQDVAMSKLGQENLSYTIPFIGPNEPYQDWVTRLRGQVDGLV